MISGFIITLREGIEVALILSLVLGYLSRSGLEALRSSAWSGFLAGIAGSALLAVLATRIRWSDELFEGSLFLAGGLLVGSLALWMQRHARTLKFELEGSLSRKASEAGWAGRLGVFSFVALTVLREGVETVLFLFTSGINTTAFLQWTGASAGLVVAAIIGILLLQGGRRLPLAPFFSATTIVLLALSLQLLVGGYHEFTEAGLLPSTKAAMAVIGPFVRYQALFFGVLAVTPAVILWRRRAPIVPLSESESGPARRLALAQKRRERWMRWAAVAAGLVVVVALAGDVLANRRKALPLPGTMIEPEHGSYRIALSTLEEGKLYRYAAWPSGADRSVRFLVLRRPGATPAAALDACEICGDLGYFQDGPNLVCRNCDAVLEPATLGTRGGCNPIPLTAIVEGDRLDITEADLAKEAHRFTTANASEDWVTDPICGMKVRRGQAIAVKRGAHTIYVCRSMNCRQKAETSAP